MTTACDACKLAETRPEYARYRAGCRTCGIRELANSPEYHHGGLDGGNAAPYRKRLATIFGADWRAGHELVKAAAKHIRNGKAVP